MADADNVVLRRQMQTLSDDIDTAERALIARRHGFLEAMGWKLTCNTPGSYWLWRRDFADVDARWKAIEIAKVARDGKAFPSPHPVIGVIVCNEDSAITMSRAILDLLYGEHPDFNND